MSYVSVKIKSRFSNKELKEILKNIPMVQMKVGWEKDQREENGARTAEVAYLNEVGHYIHTKDGKSYHVVPRPFMELACEEYQRHWAQTWRRYFRQYLAGTTQSLLDAARKFCDVVINDIRYLVEVEKPFAQNKESTLRHKRALHHPETPLVDYGTMMDKLSHEIHIAR